MAKEFVWRPAAGKPRGTYERIEKGAAAPSGRPAVSGASGSRAPGATAEPCPLGTIRVTVERSDDHQPIGNAAIAVAGQTKPASASGEATFEKISPGDHVVTITLPAKDAARFVPPPPCQVHLERSSTSKAVVVVDPTATAKVKVIDQESGRAIARARVTLRAAGQTDDLTGVTGSDGLATITGIAAGTYGVEAELDQADARRYRTPNPRPDVTIKPGQTISVELAAPPLGILVVTVLRKPPAESKAKPTPLPEVTVRLKPAAGEEITGKTDPNGAARIDAIRPGDYTLALDLGPHAAKFAAFPGEKISLKGHDNPEKRIELELPTCRVRGVKVKEITGTLKDGHLKEKTGRTFQILKPGGAKDGGAIAIKEDGLIKLVAPRQADLFKTPPASLAPLPFNPAPSAFNDGVAATWLEVELDATAHARPPATEPDHPAVVVQRGNADKVVDAHGLLKPGRCLIWGPDFPWALDPPSEKGRWLKKAGHAVSELLNGITRRAVAPSYWDLFTTHCDDNGDPITDKTTLAVFPGDRYKLKVAIPALKGWSHGVSGDYIDGEKLTTSSGTKGLGQGSTKTETTASDQGTETKTSAGRTETTTKADGTVTVEDKTVFATLFEGEYGDEPVVAFTRNGRRNQLPGDVIKTILFGATEAVKWFSDLGNLQPKWGWWVTADIALLKVSIEAEWGWMAAEKANEVDWLYQVKLSGTLIEVKITLKAGLEGTVVPSLVYFAAIIYLEVSGSAEAEWTWTSDRRPTEQQVASNAGLEVGVQLVIGNASFCEAKAWVKVPYTFQWKILPADLKAEPPREKWDVEFKHGCKDGIFVVARYKLFYGKYQGTKKVFLKEPVAMD